MRVIKEAEERKSEILDTAERLFYTKGYSKTTVMDILEAIGIAKGTFYYHFKSKEEVMDAILQRVVDRDVSTAKQIALDQSLSPAEKIIKIFKSQRPQEGGGKDHLIEQLHAPGNAEMHQKAVVLSVLSVAPVLAEIVDEGNALGVFHVEYPKEAMEFLILAGQNLFDLAMFQWTARELERKVSAVIGIMETIMGTEQGTFAELRGLLTEEGRGNRDGMQSTGK